MARIISNKAKCLKCNTVVESKHTHDFVNCKCGAMFVDGGKDYLRRGGEPYAIEELSEYSNSTVEKLDTFLRRNKYES